MRSKFWNSPRVCSCIPLCHVSHKQKHVRNIVLPFAVVKPLHVVLFTKPNFFLQFRVVFFEVTKPIFAISLGIKSSRCRVRLSMTSELRVFSAHYNCLRLSSLHAQPNQQPEAEDFFWQIQMSLFPLDRETIPVHILW